MSQKFPEGERLIYGRLVTAYRQNRLSDMVKQKQLLEFHFPSSVHLDNAHYLLGSAYFEGKYYAEALKEFTLVRDKFPDSNKRPAAMYALASTYKILGIPSLSQTVLKKLVTEYPGSPESLRAELDIQLKKNR